jgi:hypothetical protein
VFPIINQRKNDPKFVAFMDDVASLDRAQKFIDKNYRVPGVAENIDPKKSFWKEFVTYPYPVKYANAKDKGGNSWQIGYMDEYAGTDKDPKVLVIIHGMEIAALLSSVLTISTENLECLREPRCGLPSISVARSPTSCWTWGRIARRANC